MEIAAKQLLDILSSHDGMKRQSGLQKLELSISNYLEFLPQPITTQTYNEINSQHMNDGFLYGKIIAELLQSMDDNYQLNDGILENSIRRLLVVDGCTFRMVYEMLEAFGDCSNKKMNDQKMNLIVTTLERMVKGDSIYSAIIYACKPHEMNSIEEEDYLQNWREFLQALVSLPSRVANRITGKISDIFTPDIYTKLISYHIVRAVSFVNNASYEFSIKPNFKILSTMISKVVLSFGGDKFFTLFEILIDWARDDRKDIRNFIHNILVQIDGPSTEPIAVIILKTIKSPLIVEEIFLDLLNRDQWKHVLITKIPLLSYHNDNLLIVNLIYYLGCPRNGIRVLIDLLLRLLDIWGDRSALSHTSLEQHEYITKLILISVKNVKDKLKQNDKETIQRFLFEGTAAHLESLQVEIRAIGMITGEIIIEFLSDSNDAPKLVYEYDSMPAAGIQIVERLKTFVKNTDEIILRRNENHVNNPYDNDELYLGDDGRKIYQLGIECGILTGTSKGPTQKTNDIRSVTENITEPKLCDYKDSVNDENNDCEDLDSDDDLIPYDMSNDTKITEKLRPIYLRDLKENLLNVETNKDPDIFPESLQVAEELILSQLPNDDSSLAIELLEILTTLREIVHVENFELMKFRSCVAIVTVYPKECAHYLCKEFHAPIGQHSVNDRIFILDILAGASQRLSKIELNTNIDLEINGSSEQIQSTKRPKGRISLFIDVCGGKKYETLYDEDFEVSLPSHKDEKSNWDEIVQRRIQSNTRIFAHESKRPHRTINKFNDAVSSFFYPLLYGLSQKSACLYKIPKSYVDQENLLLLHFLKTLSTIMVSAENCVIAPKIGLDILELAWTLRYHEQANVRLCVIQNIASVIVSLSKETFTVEIVELLLEFRTWLFDSSQDSVRGDPDSKCRNLGQNVVALIDLAVVSTSNNGQ